MTAEVTEGAAVVTEMEMVEVAMGMAVVQRAVVGKP